MANRVVKHKYANAVHDETRLAHIQRCTHQEVIGDRAWQCLEPDPHPSGKGHRYPTDARFGRNLDEQPAVWLAAQLRTQAALNDHLQARVDELTAIAAALAQAVGQGGVIGMPQEAHDWILANAPIAAKQLRWIE